MLRIFVHQASESSDNALVWEKIINYVKTKPNHDTLLQTLFLHVFGEDSPAHETYAPEYNDAIARWLNSLPAIEIGIDLDELLEDSKPSTIPHIQPSRFMLSINPDQYYAVNSHKD